MFAGGGTPRPGTDAAGPALSPWYVSPTAAFGGCVWIASVRVGADKERGLSRALAFEINSLLLRSKAIDVIGVESTNSPVLRGLGTIAVAERLSVNNVLTGTVSLTGDSMRIEARLLDAAGVLIWNAVVEESVENLFAIQERIATSIESRLGAGTDNVPVAKVAQQRCWKPADPEALDQYFTARNYIELRSANQISIDQIKEAIEIYRGLIAMYPQFSDARSGLAFALLHQEDYDEENALPAEVLKDRTLELASQALNDCPSNGEAMHILPNEFDHENGWIGTHQQLTAFIEMEPDKLEHYQRLSGHYRFTGHHERAIAMGEKNLALNPLSPRALRNLADAYNYVWRFDEASELYDEASELGSLGPNFARFNRVIRECRSDFQCVLDSESVPPPMKTDMRRMQEPMPLIQRKPAGDEEARESVEAALALDASAPDEFTNILNAVACDFDHLAPLFFELYEQNEERGGFWFWPNVWLPSCGSVWSHPKFPDWAVRTGFVEYWREVGWPTMCQPEGESFACGSNIVARPQAENAAP